jgi:DNA repair exonuclease SbcCD ATPase subunit
MPVLEMLGDIYSAKGLKIQRMQSFAQSMERVLNQYSSLCFHEPFKFNLNVGPNQFDIIATSGRGKKISVRDIRQLSGAESRSMVILIALAVRFMLPAHARTNIMILDEIDSGMDEEGRNQFINMFLPELNKVVPHIIVITPLMDEYPDARNITVVKEGRWSRLKTE